MSGTTAKKRVKRPVLAQINSDDVTRLYRSNCYILGHPIFWATNYEISRSAPMVISDDN